MGKRLRQQRRGSGTPRYRVPSHRSQGETTYTNLPAGAGKVMKIVHGTGRYTPVATLDFSGTRRLMLPDSGMHVGEEISVNVEGGRIMMLKDIPEGSKVFNIELSPKDGGRLCRSSGVFATLIRKDIGRCVVLLPSKEKKTLSSECLATVGTAASSGRTEKPLMKAGKAHFKWHAVGKHYPHVAGVNMNAVDHPFGGQTRPGRAKTVSRHMPPGKKVGSISPRRVGRRKK